MSINNIEQLRLWFRECPAIVKKNRFGINHISEKAVEYALYSSPSTLSYKENVLGERVLESIQTENYIFASKENYGADIEKNIEVLGWYQEVITWIIQQNNEGNFPEIENGKVKSILPTLTAYPAEVGSSVAKYQIQIAVRYRLNN
ncbi:MAG: hypothetical protein IKP31_07655 [Lachnospiraceae bacterium]|nr:hypothetical protein [Lachnospiraceae bacterium]